MLGDDELLKRLKALIERALGALTVHLGYEKGDPAGRGTGNIRNGYSKKTLKTDDCTMDIEVPRDREGSFEPQLVPKGETRFDGFDDRIVSFYARGMTVREIQGHMQELYAVEVSPEVEQTSFFARASTGRRSRTLEGAGTDAHRGFQPASVAGFLPPRE